MCGMITEDNSQPKYFMELMSVLNELDLKTVY